MGVQRFPEKTRRLFQSLPVNSETFSDFMYLLTDLGVSCNRWLAQGLREIPGYAYPL